MANRVRFTGNKPPPRQPWYNDNQYSEGDPLSLFDPDYWRQNLPGMSAELRQIPRDAGQWISDTWYDRRGGGRSFGQRVRDAWDTGMAVNQDIPVSSFPNYMQWSRQAAPAQGAMIAYGAIDTFLSGTKNWRPQVQATQYNQGNQVAQYNQGPQFTRYNQGAANTSGMSNAEILRQRQLDMIAARQAERLVGAPDWVQRLYSVQPGAVNYNQVAQYNQGYYQAPRQQLQQATNYRQPVMAGNPYAGRVDPSMRRGPDWEKRHNAWVQNIRRARAGVK